MGVFQTQFDEYEAIIDQNPNTGESGNAEVNQRFLQTYASSGTMSQQAYESWQVYNQWLLGIETEHSRGVWDGWTKSFSYNYWHLYKKEDSFNAVARV